MKRFNSYPIKKHEDKIVYADGIVDNIVLLALTEIPYVELDADLTHPKNAYKAFKVVLSTEGVFVEVKVKIHYTQNVTDMAFKIQEAIRHNIEAMTDYKVTGVNVIVNDVLLNDVVEKPVSLEVQDVEEEKKETESTKD